MRRARELEADDALGAEQIGVWGATQYWDGSGWRKADQMGRPAINTVFNNPLVDAMSSTTKNQFNTTEPSRQRTAFGGRFRNNIIATLTNINAALGTGGTDYDNATAGMIAKLEEAWLAQDAAP